MQPAAASWQTWQRFLFRFFFLFLGTTSIFCWHFFLYIASIAFIKNPAWHLGVLYKPLAKPFHWLDKHFFHTGYSLNMDTAPFDNHFGVIFYLTIFLLAIAGVIAWSLLDKKKSNYDKLFYWFNIYLRYTLALVIFGYGIDKLIPVQMSYPGVISMITPFGEESRFDVLWNFMGVSPGYMIFTGASEIIGSLLLLSRRTALAGYLLLLAVLSNVVALNFFYNVPVKLFSSQLLLYDLYLIAPYGKKIFQFVFSDHLIPQPQKYYVFQTSWKKYTEKLLLIFFTFIIFLLTTIVTYQRYEKQKLTAKREKIYEVTTFISTDTLPPLLTDTLRWKRFLFAYENYVVICNMKDQRDWYQCDVDSIKKTFTLHDNPDTSTWKIFHYAYSGKDQLQLTGKWKGKDVTIEMKSVPVDSMFLNKEKTVLMQD